MIISIFIDHVITSLFSKDFENAFFLIIFEFFKYIFPQYNCLKVHYAILIIC
jgi:hypothetical protein